MPIHILVHQVFAEKDVFDRTCALHRKGRAPVLQQQIVRNIRNILVSIRYATEKCIPVEVIEFVGVEGTAKEGSIQRISASVHGRSVSIISATALGLHPALPIAILSCASPSIKSAAMLS